MIQFNRNTFLFLFIVSTFCLFNQSYSAVHKRPLAVAVIPGISGGDFFADTVHNHINYDVMPYPVPTPIYAIDLGQRFCQRHLENTLKKITDPFIIDASSQGTATALNYLAKNPDIAERTQALILTGTLASGNSGILQELTNWPFLSFMADLPFSYYFVPYITKLLPPFWTYSPSGQQAIDAVENIRKSKIPIILVHGMDDPEVSSNDSRALYYKLRENENKYVYLILVNTKQHVGILYHNTQARKAVQSILQHHKLIDTSDSNNVMDYQPDHVQFKQYYDALRYKENVHKVIGTVITICAILGITALAKKYRTKLTRYFAIASHDQTDETTS